MNTAKQLRADIMEMLFKTKDLKILKSIHSELQKSKSEERLTFLEAVKPVRKGVSLQEIMDEQDYQPVEYAIFRANADKIEWEESLEELLKALEK